MPRKNSTSVLRLTHIDGRLIYPGIGVHDLIKQRIGIILMGRMVTDLAISLLSFSFR